MKAGAILLTAAAAFLAGTVFAARAPADAPAGGEREVAHVNRLTSPFLECVGETPASRDLTSAREKVAAFIGDAQKVDPSLRVSVYTRDLVDGSWMGINEAEPYVPASLLKVHVLVYVMAEADRDPTLLERTVVYPGPEAMNIEDSMVGAPSELRMTAGTAYSYEDLLHRMIVNSDNYAKALLLSAMDATEADIDRFTQSFNASPAYEGGQPVVNARTFSSVFRILYNATLLSRATSERTLQLLTKTMFRDGMRKYIPPSVAVASKFGYQTYQGPLASKSQLHECGIVYRPAGPYVQCIMMKSNQADARELSEIMARIALIVWDTKAD